MFLNGILLELGKAKSFKTFVPALIPKFNVQRYVKGTGYVKETGNSSPQHFSNRWL